MNIFLFLSYVLKKKYSYNQILYRGGNVVEATAGFCGVHVTDALVEAYLS